MGTRGLTAFLRRNWRSWLVRLSDFVRRNRELAVAVLLIAAYVVLNRLGFTYHYLALIVIGIFLIMIFLRKPFYAFLGFVIATQLFEYSLINGVPIGRIYGIVIIIITVAYYAINRYEFQSRVKYVFDVNGRLLVIVLLCYTISTVVNPNPQLIFFQRHFMFFAFYIITRLYVSNRALLRNVLLLLVILQAINSLYGIYQFFSTSGHIRASGIWEGDPNEFACYSLAVMPIGLYLIMHESKRSLKSVMIIGTCLLGISVVISASRSGLLTMAFVGLLILVNKRVPLRVRVLSVIITVIIVILVASNIYWERIETIQDYFFDREKERSIEIRELLAKDSFIVFLENPIFGIGYKHFRVAPIEEAAGLIIRNKRLAHHSMYLAAMTQFGLFGLVPFMFLLGYTIRSGFRGARIALKNSDRKLMYLTSATTYSFIVVVIFGLMLNTDTKFLYFYLALAASSWELVYRKHGKSAPAAAGRQVS
jgi:O-antigen ligase